MAAKKSADEWFAEYGQNHQHPTSEFIHWVCVPMMVAALLGFIWSIPVPISWIEAVPWFNWALVAVVLTTLYYLRLSPALSAGMLFFMSVCYLGIAMLDLFAPWAVWKIALVVLVLAWIGQLLAHRIEGTRPAIPKDIQFLLVGPARMMSVVYKKLGQPY
jgi:uncharacterized membrane protein YGL010W